MTWLGGTVVAVMALAAQREEAGMLAIGDTCRNCGQPITWRTKVQGWVHGDGSRRCTAKWAEPTFTMRTPE